MLKKYILTAVFGMMLLSAPTAPAAAAVAMQSDEVTEQVIIVENEINPATNDDSQVQESPIAKKMTQAEKAENAAVNDKYGGAITIIAMCIVISALVILSLLFLLFGKISSSMLSRKKKEAHGVTSETAEDHHEEVDSGEVIAAIGMALSEYFGQGHDMEDTILTIKRMKKSYSPWNSKIYNMRTMPDHNRAR